MIFQLECKKQNVDGVERSHITRVLRRLSQHHNNKYVVCVGFVEMNLKKQNNLRVISNA